nr:immunoglobulin light chain junction region [Macaca mulatta]MOV61372.1 immunoglobulin light chain junction region [Macaca mulatta]MOV61388.1 immunoglobulin light chain junction region [Macaca mulatta]MOV61425.1 immunoglobulin light chain junction region [Macaca mulatta]MOV61756.1 immunoglobulin light chain junction region [Macaca mulatta]
CQQHNTYPFTF